MIIENVILLNYRLLWVNTEKTGNDLYLQGAESLRFVYKKRNSFTYLSPKQQNNSIYTVICAFNW